MRDEHLRAFVSAARAGAEADGRRRRRWLGRQLDESRTFEEACRTIAGSGARVRLLVANGRTHSGRIATVGPGVVALAGDPAVVYIALEAVVGLEPLDGDAPAGVPHAVTASTIDDVVIALGERRRAVVVATRDGTVHRGRIAGVGRDVLWFDTGRHLRLSSIIEVAAAP